MKAPIETGMKSQSLNIFHNIKIYEEFQFAEQQQISEQKISKNLIQIK